MASLADGDSFSFDIFYGASATEIGALTALALVGAEVYALGQSNCDKDGTGAYCSDYASNTFIFGFAGVGGEVVPSPIPLPGAAILFMTGLGALGSLRLRRSKAA